MSQDDDGAPVSDDPKNPVDSQQEPGAPTARNIALGSGRSRSEGIFHRRLQRLDEMEARRAARLRPQSIPLRGQPGQAQDQNAAPAEPAETTEHKIGKIDGQGNISSMATTAYTNIYQYFINGKLEESFKDGESLGAPNEEDERSPDAASDSSREAPTSTGEMIIEGIQSGSTGAAFVNESRTRATVGVTALPKNDKEIESWYYQVLNERDRCFVKAAAVLHGAPLRAIAEATSELYAPLKEKEEERKAQVLAKLQPLESMPPVPSVPSSPPSSVSEFLMRVYSLIQQEERARAVQTKASASESVSASTSPTDTAFDSIDSLLEKTHTYTLRVNGATRLLWQDADSSGLSRFSVDLLRFLAREAAMEDMFSSQPEQRFLDIIGQWPTKYRGERSWRSASALGIIWWHQDARNLLWREANKWAKSQQVQDWGHAAALLDGAYQVERDTMKASGDQVVSSSVLQLLDQWIATAHQAKSERGEGFAAARAYALIGRKSPEIALKGLDRLLRFPQPQAANEDSRYPPEDLFVFSVLKYVDIVRSGHIRQVLKYLADEAELYAHWRGSPQFMGQGRENPHQRTVTLHITFTAFFLVASCSLSAVDDMVPATYTTTGRLSDHLSCPDSKGRDILLAGLLTEAEQPLWQEQLATILCALIIEKNYQPALYLMRRWGEIMLQDQSPVLEETYARFLVKVGELIRAWTTHRGPAQLFAFGTYRYGLTLWLTDRRLPQPGFARLAQKVLNQLPETN